PLRLLFFFYSHPTHRALHSFPTRRSSDLFDAPTAYAAVKLSRNALSGTSEFDASHASIIGCDFRNGLYGIEDSGGCFNVTVRDGDRKSTRLNSSHLGISYAVFCLNKKITA